MPFSAISTGLGLLGGLFGSKKQNDQQQAQADAYNKYLQNYQQGQKNYLNYLQNSPNPYQSTTGSSTTNTNQTTDETTNPFLTNGFGSLVDVARNAMQQRLTGPSSLPQGYLQNQIRDINSAAAGASAAAQNQAARFGLSGSQAAALSGPAEVNRVNQIASAQANAPLLERQMRNEDLGIASSLANSFGKGTQSHGTTRGTSTTNSSGYTTMNKPYAGMEAFAAPGPQAPGPQDTGMSNIFGALGGAMQGGLGDLIGGMLSKKKSGNTGFSGNWGNGQYDSNPFSGIGFESQDSGGGGGYPGFSSMTRPF